MLVCLFLITLSRPVYAQQRSSTARPTADAGIPQQVLVDTSGRLDGASKVPRVRGNSLGVIDSATIAASAATTLSDLLAAHVAGVSVLRSSGVAGSGSRMRLRGANSFYGAREPILVVDGVRVDAAQTAHGLGTEAQRRSRIDDIDIRDVRRIEILRGPAASALYGTDGAGGVIRVTTARPQHHGVSWYAFGEGTASMDATDYPANYSTGSGLVDTESCTRAEAALGSCVAGPLRRWNPLENASPFRTAPRGSTGAGVSGALGRLGVLASASVHNEAGVLAPNDVTRYATRLNADAQLLPSLRLALNSAYVHSRVRLPLIDGRIPARLEAGLDGNAVDDPINRGYRARDLPVSLDTPTDEQVGRAMGSLTGMWTPFHWLTARVTAGGESLRGDDDRATGVGFDSTRSEGRVIQRSTDRDSHTNADGSLTGFFRVTRSLTSETTLGVEHLHRATYAADSTGIGSAFNYFQSWTHTDVNGLLVSERLAWRERRYLGVGVRRDRWHRSVFAPATFLSADAAWVIGDEPFFPRGSFLTHMRLRGAYGRSKDVRTYALAPQTFFAPSVGDDVPDEARGETVSELELGLDALLFDRLWVEATWFRQHSGDALSQCCAFSTPIGEWRTVGVDATLSASLVRSPDLDWSARLDVSAFSNRIDDLGQGATSASAGEALLGLVRIRNVTDHPIGGVWGNPIRIRDANGDGVITAAEVAVDQNPVYLGSSIPTREVSLSSTVAIRRVSINVLVDYRGGFKQVNGTEAFRCELELCRGLYDPGASLDDQSRAVAVFRSGASFVEDASFVRLRELGVTWKLQPRWARVELGAAARNLLTFSGYSGLDPEVNYAGQVRFSRGEFNTLPLPRTMVVRLRLQR
jgi:TonB-dependent SusC/RagA subfamily outer membrane receptor